LGIEITINFVLKGTAVLCV